MDFRGEPLPDVGRHEFLDAIRNDTVWNKVKATVKEKGGAIPFEVLKLLAIQAAKSVFGIG